MREILFRGKRIDNEEWIEGYFVYCKSEYDYEKTAEIIPREADRIYRGEYDLYDVREVDPDTVGQFTGLTDKNGKRIFEGDIIKSDNGVRPPTTSVVKFGENFPTMFYAMMSALYRGYKKLPAIGFYAETTDMHQHLILFQSPFVEVIGNIHDNPELIGERKDDEVSKTKNEQH